MFESGDELGHRYRIEALLGQGGMGRVYQAYDKELDRVVALKVLQPELSSDPNAMQRFKQELLLASRISHKNILRIHDLGEADGVRFISMAFVEGEDLHHLLRAHGRLSVERAQKIAVQLCEALDAAHAEGVVHRDLKPQNILMGKNDQVFVVDFGLAKSLEASTAGMTRSGQYLGTPRYMAPEQVEAKPVDNRTDLYALGLILFEMVTGEEPFKGDSTLQIMYRRVKEKPPNPKDLNPELPDYFSRIVLRCLAKDPARRYQNAREILADLTASHATSGARTVQFTLPTIERKSWLITAGVVLALLVLLLAVPPIRHFVFRTGSGASGGPSAPRGVPPLSTGRYVAVLPLQVLGDQNQLGYLAQGIEEALSTKLFQSQDIRVTSTDAAGHVNQKQSLVKIARELGANLLVQGTLQAAGDKIRVTINLEDVADGKHVWGQEFNGVTGDLFTLEDQIYNQVVSALQVNPTNEEKAKAEARPTENIAAYDLYLRGRNALRNTQDPKSIQQALDYFSQALNKDSTFALAYTGIADGSLRMYHIQKDRIWTQKALSAAQQAEQLNDKLPEVHLALGSVYSETGKYSEAIAEITQALALAPNSDQAYRSLGDAYLRSGDSAKAIASYEKAIQLDPYYWFNEDILGNAYFRMSDYQKALAAYQQVTQLDPDNSTGYGSTGMVLAQEGKFQDAIPPLQKAIQLDPDWTAYTNLGDVYFFLKNYQQAAQEFEQAVKLDPNNEINAGNLADSYRLAGERDKAQAEYQNAVTLAYQELQTNPQDADVLDHLAVYYAKLGNAQQADSFIRRARAIRPGEVNYIYDEGKIDALLGRTGPALKMLEEAFQKHYPVESASSDPDLSPLQANPAYAKLLKEYARK